MSKSTYEVILEETIDDVVHYKNVIKVDITHGVLTFWPAGECFIVVSPAVKWRVLEISS